MRPHHSSSQHLGGYPPSSHHHGQLGPRHGSMPYEGSSNGYPPASSSRYPSGSNSYYYSSSAAARPQPHNAAAGIGSNSAAPSPSAHSYRTNASVDHPTLQHHSSSTMPGRRGGSVGPSPHYDAEPSYHVEHLATFAVGRQFGLLSAQDGIRKLKQMEKQSAIWAQPLLLKLKPDKVSVEDENGEIVEQFSMDLIVDPTAHQTHDNMDTYNNILLFVVKEDTRNIGRQKAPTNPTEMHIFQCVRVSAVDVAQDMLLYARGQIQKVRGGRRDTGYGGSIDASPYGPLPQQNFYRDDASPSSNSSEQIDMSVNTLNRCFDDIEKFVARIQSAAMAQREIEMLRIRMRNKPRGKNEIPGILQLRAQMPQPAEFYEILQKFKLSINILTSVQNYIHDPNAPELLHFLFTPLKVIVDACNWGLGQDIATKVVSPLLSYQALELLKQCLNNAEFDLWMSLGQYWRTSPEEWTGPPPAPFRPVFRDNFAPYGYPQQAAPQRQPPQQMHRGSSAPPAQQYPSSRPPQRSTDDIDLERVNLEKERLAFERMKILDRERRLEEEEQRLRREEARIEAERKLLVIEAQKARNASGNVYITTQPSPNKTTKQGGVNPQIQAFLSDLHKHNRKIVEVLYDRLKQHEKELTVTRGEYLEVLSDEKNWWECRNSQNLVGFVPHTILSVLRSEDVQAILNSSNGFNDPNTIPNYNPPAAIESASLSPRPGMMTDDTPDYIKQRQGKRGEFRYF
jgi:epidermal growth factor receptor kinase substrate 8